jgi:hypothetical protein
MLKRRRRSPALLFADEWNAFFIHLFCDNRPAMKRIVTLAFLLSLAALPAFSWGEKGHLLSNEAATHGLPNDMPAFFHQAYPELVYLGPEPDRWRGSGGQSLEPASGPDHFLDYEFVEGLKLPPDRYKYMDLMETSGRLKQRGISNAEAGFVPWRIAELTEMLTVEFRLWRSSAPNSEERGYIERNIIHVAGVLGHYVADSANPHHATIHYNGWAGTTNPNRYANDCGTHSRFESAFISRAVDLSDITPKLAAPVLRADYFKTALELIQSSNALVDKLYTLDRDGNFDPLRPVSKEGVAFASGRIAVGSSLLRDLWWSAWKNSAPRPRKTD